MEDEDKKKVLEKVKEIHSKIPKKKEEIFEFPINWNNLFKFDIIEKSVRT
jgi:hypothetical protein